MALTSYRDHTGAVVNPDPAKRVNVIARRAGQDVEINIPARWVGSADYCQVCFYEIKGGCFCRTVQPKPKPTYVDQVNDVYNIIGGLVTRNCGRCGKPEEICYLGRIVILVGWKDDERVDVVPDPDNGGILTEILVTKRRPVVRGTEGCAECYALYLTAKADAKARSEKTGDPERIAYLERLD